MRSLRGEILVRILCTATLLETAFLGTLGTAEGSWGEHFLSPI